MILLLLGILLNTPIIKGDKPWCTVSSQNVVDCSYNTYDEAWVVCFPNYHQDDNNYCETIEPNPNESPQSRMN